MTAFRGALSACMLCPRRCGADRAAGRTGFCGAGARAQVYRYGPHMGEEPPITGAAGSGTVFFSRCTLRCLYCQNYPWSQEARGEPKTVDELAAIFLGLRDAGCHNLNLVSPTPWLPFVVAALEAAKKAGFSLPLVYNTSGFECSETLDELAGTVDVYLTDLRYARAETAEEASGRGDVVSVAREGLARMWGQTGPLRMDEQGVARTGTICRFLVLPGHADEAIENLRWAARHIGPELPISVMAQYTPAYRACGDPVWGRRVARDEYERVCDAVASLGFENGWVQDVDDSPDPGDLAGFRMKEGQGERMKV